MIKKKENENIPLYVLECPNQDLKNECIQAVNNHTTPKKTINTLMRKCLLISEQEKEKNIIETQKTTFQFLVDNL